MPAPSGICNLHHSSQRCQILNPLSEARDRTCILLDTSQIYFCWAMTGTLVIPKSYLLHLFFLWPSWTITGCELLYLNRVMLYRNDINLHPVLPLAVVPLASLHFLYYQALESWDLGKTPQTLRNRVHSDGLALKLEPSQKNQIPGNTPDQGGKRLICWEL